MVTESARRQSQAKEQGEGADTVSNGLSTDALVRARALQNEYAFAIDTRDWGRFERLFAPDVSAVYPHATYAGISEWVEAFAAMHDQFGWTRHEMTNHIAGLDEHGLWAACYGFIEWVSHDASDRISTTRALYRDRLREDEGEWVIARRELVLLSSHPRRPRPEGMQLIHTLEHLDPTVRRAAGA